MTHTYIDNACSKDDLDNLEILMKEYETLSRSYLELLNKQIRDLQRRVRCQLIFIYVWLAVCILYILLAVFGVFPSEYLYMLTALNIGIVIAQTINNLS